MPMCHRFNSPLNRRPLGGSWPSAAPPSPFRWRSASSPRPPGETPPVWLQARACAYHGDASVAGPQLGIWAPSSTCRRAPRFQPPARCTPKFAGRSACCGTSSTPFATRPPTSRATICRWARRPLPATLPATQTPACPRAAPSACAAGCPPGAWLPAGAPRHPGLARRPPPHQLPRHVQRAQVRGRGEGAGESRPAPPAACQRWRAAVCARRLRPPCPPRLCRAPPRAAGTPATSWRCWARPSPASTPASTAPCCWLTLRRSFTQRRSPSWRLMWSAWGWVRARRAGRGSRRSGVGRVQGQACRPPRAGVCSLGSRHAPCLRRACATLAPCRPARVCRLVPRGHHPLPALLR